MPRYFVKVTSGRVYPNVSVSAPWKALARIRLLLEGIGSRGARFETYQENVNYGTPATGIFTGSTLSGVVGVSINGLAGITVTASGGDAATCVALAAAINADPTYSKYVTAVASGSTVILTADTEPTDHIIGNAISLATSGAGTGQSVSGAKLGTGGGATAGVNASVNAYQF